MKLTSAPDSQPQREKKGKPAAYSTWQPNPEKYETKEQVMNNIAKGLNSHEFQEFVRLVGKEVAYSYIRRMLENKTRD